MQHKIFFAIVLVVHAFLTSCNEKKSNPKNDNRTNNEVAKVPKEIISIEEAKAVYDNYTKKRAELIEATEPPLEDGSKFIASRFGDYDIETIKNYIAYVEQQADLAGVKVETLRFYFSTYPDQKEFSDNRKVMHPRQNSFFILPTIKVDTFNYGFYIKDLGNGKKEAELIRDYPGIQVKGFGNATTSNKSYASIAPNFLNTSSNVFFGTESLILNDSHMSPPPRRKADF